MCAIDRENLKILPINISYPARYICRVSIGRRDSRVSIGGEARLTGRKLPKVAQRNPAVIAPFPLVRNGGKQVAHDRHSQNHAYDAVQEDSDLHEEIAPAKVRR
jgi:hypothetical protein